MLKYEVCFVPAPRIFTDCHPKRQVSQETWILNKSKNVLKMKVNSENQTYR